jgi:hypothetical protein
MRNILFVLFVLLHLDYACALDIEQTWTEEIYLEKNEISYSVFSIQLKIDNSNRGIMFYC